MTAAEPRELRRLMIDAGMGSFANITRWLQRGEVSINNAGATPDSTVSRGDHILLKGMHLYRIEGVSHTHRWIISPETPEPEARIAGLRRVHCGQHKCLTMYVRGVLERMCQSGFSANISFRHFFGRRDEFYRHSGDYDIASISGHRIDLDRFEDVRVSRFVRDPRDLVVSGYFYHKRRAEGWCGYVNPHPAEWERVNGAIPENLPDKQSLTSFLESVPMEEGLKAEIDFRRYHFDSMRGWDEGDPRVLTFRYEDIIGNETAVFRKLLRHYQLPLTSRLMGQLHAHRLKASRRRGKNTHIRDPNAGQWRKHFTPSLTRHFKETHGDLLELYGYPPD